MLTLYLAIVWKTFIYNFTYHLDNALVIYFVNE